MAACFAIAPQAKIEAEQRQALEEAKLAEAGGLRVFTPMFAKQENYSMRSLVYFILGGGSSRVWSHHGSQPQPKNHHPFLVNLNNGAVDVQEKKLQEEAQAAAKAHAAFISLIQTFVVHHLQDLLLLLP